MIETLVGSSLAAAAGLNAWIPLLILGLLSRFTDLVPLPGTWQWLSSDLALWIIGGLLIVEVVADKVPALDTVNDIIHTAIRPAAGGIAFGAGASAEALTLDDAASWSTIDWGPVITGIVIALLVHGIKATARPVANLATAGVAAPVLSTIEDGVSVVVSVLAILLPVLAIVLVIALVIGGVMLIRRGRRRRRELRAAQTG
ncbi:DUF4126 domain-containing protein [Microbacterium sp. ZW T5_56]|uniref:DUF4126 domain-containing protein n=1 Tax=Microbacterium sp. ZW T5_56 TaxID=3378081 RepID=UPI00385398FE